MTTFALPLWSALFPGPKVQPEVRSAPPAPAPAAPVFIYDAVTPYRGETLLLARLRADVERALERGDDHRGSG